MDQPRIPAALTRRAALAAGLALPAAGALAQAPWPTRPISMVAPLAAGSSVDILARLVAEQWSQRLGQPVPVENRPAANGTLALAAGLALPAAGALAQAPWPTRPISMVAPLAAGSSVDILARLVAEQWSQRLGQPVPVENRPAANGTLALGQVARAPADGYTITVTSQTGVAFNPVLYPSIPYDPLRDFAYIARIAGISNALVVRTASPFRSFAELLAAARAEPGKLTYSSGGVGTTHHISSAMLAQQARLEMVHVPYRGAAQGILAAQSGEVDFAYFNISTLLPGIRQGAFRPLAVTSAERSPFLPDVPTMKELGFPDYEMTTWVGIGTVAAVPAPILARMVEVTEAMLADAAVQRRLVELGFEVLPPIPQPQMLDFVRAEKERWEPVIRASGARRE